MEPELGRLHWTAIGLVWILMSFGTGALLAWLYRRLYAGLSFYYLWAFWTAVASLIAVAVLALGLV